jgi:hypothetical protein
MKLPAIRFELFPVLDTMIELYQKPLSIERFKEYLTILNGGDSAELLVPISGFNPMAKDHVLQALTALKKLNAEDIASQEILKINQEIPLDQEARIFKVALNLSDDLKGGWTNRFTTDYQSKFKIGGYFSRNFCLPVLWTSDIFSEELIQERVREYVFRTIYWSEFSRPETLRDHIFQEKFVAEKLGKVPSITLNQFAELSTFYNQYKSSEEYHIIFSFLYGDKAAISLGNADMGIEPGFAGFEFAAGGHIED